MHKDTSNDDCHKFEVKIQTTIEGQRRESPKRKQEWSDMKNKAIILVRLGATSTSVMMIISGNIHTLWSSCL